MQAVLRIGGAPANRGWRYFSIGALLLIVGTVLPLNAADQSGAEAGISDTATVEQRVSRSQSLEQNAGEGGSVLVEGDLLIHFWPGGEKMAERLAEAARTMPPLPALPEGGLTDGGPISVFLAPDEARFDSLAGGRAPEWSAALAIPAARVIILPAFLSDRAAPHQLARLLRHELAHVVLHEYLAPAVAPRWFDEGYAQWAAGEWGWDAAWQLRLAFALNRAPPLDSISLNWPAAAADARIAYLLALSTVAYLIEHGGGEAGLRLFLERWREGGTLEPALRQTYGLTLAQFESDWIREVRQRYGWALLFTHSMIFWIPIAGLVVILTIRRRRRMRARLEELRANEIPDRPAYWLGEVAVEEGGGEGVEGEEVVEREEKVVGRDLIRPDRSLD